MRLLITFLLVLTTSIISKAQDIKYTVDVKKSEVRWIGYYLFSFDEHRGTIGLTNGTLTKSNKVFVAGTFELDMQKIHDTDMPADNGGKDLEEHLKSGDFFDAENFPTATFAIIKSEVPKDVKEVAKQVDITGNLTIKGITNQITFPAKVDVIGTQLFIHAQFKFDRTKWNIKYSSGTFFQNLGNGAISDAIGIEIDLVAVQVTSLRATN